MKYNRAHKDNICEMLYPPPHQVSHRITQHNASSCENIKIIYNGHSVLEKYLTDGTGNVFWSPD